MPGTPATTPGLGIPRYANADAVDFAGQVNAVSDRVETMLNTHAARHQDGGADALTVREAMMATGALGMAKGAFSAYRNTAITAATSGTVVFDAEEFDVSSWHNTATGRFTPQIAGYYRLNAVITFTSTASGNEANVSLFKNGASFKALGQIHSANTSFGLTFGGSVLVAANGTTDFFTIGWSSNVAISPVAGAANSYFQGHLIGRS